MFLAFIKQLVNGTQLCTKVYNITIKDQGKGSRGRVSIIKMKRDGVFVMWHFINGNIEIARLFRDLVNYPCLRLIHRCTF